MMIDHLERWNPQLLFAGFILLLAVPAAPAAAAPLWGTQTQAQLADVLSNNAQTNPSTDGALGVGLPGEGVFFDESQVTDVRGDAHSIAGLSFGTNQLPVVKASSILSGATSGVGGAVAAVARADAFASEIFQYTGPTVSNGSLKLTFDLDGVLANSPIDPTGQTFIIAKVAIFEATDYFFDPFLDNLLFGPGPLPVAKASDTSTLLITSDTGGVATNKTVDLMFSAAQNEIFYVHMSLFTHAFRDTRAADAFSTLTGAFETPANFLSLSVPEPGAAGILACCLAAFAAYARRRAT